MSAPSPHRRRSPLRLVALVGMLTLVGCMPTPPEPDREPVTIGFEAPQDAPPLTAEPTPESTPEAPTPEPTPEAPTPEPTPLALAPGPSSEATEEPEECLHIKGNISVRTGERIYHLPGQEYYDETEISLSRGERWFCTEEEAIAAGWRKAYV